MAAQGIDPGVFAAKGGTARLLHREELPADWDPGTDRHLTDWECAQHLARVLDASDGGIDAAARLFARMLPGRGEAARLLAYRLYDICERKDRECGRWHAMSSALSKGKDFASIVLRR